MPDYATSVEEQMQDLLLFDGREKERGEEMSQEHNFNNFIWGAKFKRSVPAVKFSDGNSGENVV